MLRPLVFKLMTNNQKTKEFFFLEAQSQKGGQTFL